jgi:hypothetical protein
MCKSPLDITPQSSSLPTANVLELTGDDIAHKYVIKVPSNIKADEAFEILLDLRLFSVICPVDAEGGDLINVIAPAREPLLYINAKTSNPHTHPNPNPNPEGGDLINVIAPAREPLLYIDAKTSNPHTHPNPNPEGGDLINVIARAREPLLYIDTETSNPHPIPNPAGGDLINVIAPAREPLLYIDAETSNPNPNPNLEGGDLINVIARAREPLLYIDTETSEPMMTADKLTLKGILTAETALSASTSPPLIQPLEVQPMATTISYIYICM